MSRRRNAGTQAELRHLREVLSRIELDMGRLRDNQQRDQRILSMLPERIGKIETLIAHETDRRNYRRAVIAAILSGALGALATALVTLL